MDHLHSRIFRKIVSFIIALFLCYKPKALPHTGKGNLNREEEMLQMYRYNGINITCWKVRSISFQDEKRPNFQRGIILGSTSVLLPSSTQCETIYTQRSVLLCGKNLTAGFNCLYVKASPIISLCWQTFCVLHTQGWILLGVLWIYIAFYLSPKDPTVLSVRSTCYHLCIWKFFCL